MLQSFQFYLTTNKSIKTKDVLDRALYPNVFFSCSGIFFNSCWHGVCTLPHLTLRAAAPGTISEGGSHLPVTTAPWPRPQLTGCTLFIEGKMLGEAGLQPRVEQMYEWHLQAEKPTCFLGMSHLISVVFCCDTGSLQSSGSRICSWRSP